MLGRILASWRAWRTDLWVAWMGAALRAVSRAVCPDNPPGPLRRLGLDFITPTIRRLYQERLAALQRSAKPPTARWWRLGAGCGRSPRESPPTESDVPKGRISVLVAGAGLPVYGRGLLARGDSVASGTRTILCFHRRIARQRISRC
jgi:hypothetical protein